MRRVVLFKTPPSTDGEDPYRQHFEGSGYQLDYVPVLQEEFRTENLLRLFRDDDRKQIWAGVVITSKRGAEGWVRAAGQSADESSPVSTDWKEIQLFTVGSSSIDYLASTQSTLPPRLQLDTDHAVQAKSATELLPLLTPREQDGSYLIIRGDKTTNELQLGLSAAKRDYHQIEVYTTSARPTLSSDVDAALRMMEGWLVFFSPSSAELVLPFIKNRLDDLRIAAIGLTTERYLVQQGVKVNAVAEEPTAEGLLQAIQIYEESKEGA